MRLARKGKRRIIIGGDFNTQCDVGNRGRVFQDFLQEHALRAGNVSDELNGDVNDNWTFCSSLGIKRRIDYILLDLQTYVQSCKPTVYLDLGSDHRAVHAQVQIITQNGNQRIRSNRRRKR